LLIRKFPGNFLKESRRFIAVALAALMMVMPVFAGITISRSTGIVMTGADGVVFNDASGIVMTGADGFLTNGTNGIVMTGADGIVMTGADAFYEPNSVRMTSADGIVMTGADGIVMTGADGIVMTGADGTTYRANSVTITQANGIVMTGADGIVMTGADGVKQNGADGIVMTGADGIVMTGADGIVMTGADSIRAIGADGTIYSITPNGVTFSGVTGIVMTGADGINVTGATGIVMTGADGIVMTGADATRSGLQSVDPELAVQLTRLTDDSNVNAVIVYHQLPIDADIADLQTIGVQGGTRYRALPMITVTATRRQLVAISRLSSVRSIYGTRTLDSTLEPEVRAETGVNRVRTDRDLTIQNSGLPVSGRGITVALVDTGVDGTHGDLSGRVLQNVKLADTQSASAGFNYPVNLENVPDTDQAYGHGTFVAGVMAGNGLQSGGKYSGIAPGAKVVGLSAGDLNLIYVLEGFDYLLTRGAELGVRVVNCSFSANTVYDTNDPVNVATRMLTDRGINVVVSAGNAGPGTHSLNPYAVSPWVVSVGATDTQGRLTSFSSRGDFGSPLFHPTLVAPGFTVVSLRGSGITNVTGADGLANADAQRLSASELPFYTTASGTSFSAPQVAGAIALMLEANPSLTPAQVKDILEQSATPLPPYYQYEVGAGMLNVHAAVLQAAFPSRNIGAWRGTLNWGQVNFVNDPLVQFSGTALPATASDTTLAIPADALLASVQVSWGPFWSASQLGLSLYSPDGSLSGQSNVLALPGLTGNRQRVAVKLPAAGPWRASVKSGIGAVTTQSFVGVMEVGRAVYSPMNDIGGLSAAARSEIFQNIRSFVMQPNGSIFGPGLAVSRSDLATALVLGARVPQYSPGQSRYPDVQDASTTLFVESVQASPTGPLFYDASPGGNFRPADPASRLTAAVALVRAAGLSSEADAKKNAPLGFLDALSIPADLRGYVAVAVAHGFLVSDTYFRPQSSLTRAELAHAMVALETLATQ
jgi:serine protease AprX